jgi:hypothetical protein
MRKALVLFMLLLSACRPLPMYTALEVPKRQVVELRGDPELRGLVQDVAREGMKSAVGALDEQATAQLRALFLEMTRQLVAELRAIVADALAGLEPKTAALVEGTMSSMTEQLPRALGPAVRGIIVDELLDKPEFRRALDDTSRDIGKQAVLGANEAMIELARSKQRGTYSPIGAAGELLSTQSWIAGVLAVAAALAAAVLLWQRRRMHVAESEAERLRKMVAARRRPTLRHA